MKKILYLFVLMISLTGISQTKAPAKKLTPKTTTKINNDQKVVTKNLYTIKEKEKIAQNFYKDVEKLGLSPEVKKQYLELVNATSTKLKYINHDRGRTREQIKASSDKIFNDQNIKIKSLLTFKQYQNHLLIYNRLQESIKFRADKSK